MSDNAWRAAPAENVLHVAFTYEVDGRTYGWTLVGSDNYFIEGTQCGQWNDEGNEWTGSARYEFAVNRHPAPVEFRYPETWAVKTGVMVPPPYDKHFGFV